MHNWRRGRQIERETTEKRETAAASSPAERRGKAEKRPLVWGRVVQTYEKAALVGGDNQKTATLGLGGIGQCRKDEKFQRSSRKEME